MYDSTKIVDVIKKTAKEKNILVRKLLFDCGLGINALSQMSKGKVMGYESLAKIADCLGVSVDYLLGRTDIATVTTPKGEVINLKNEKGHIIMSKDNINEFEGLAKSMPSSNEIEQLKSEFDLLKETKELAKIMNERNLPREYELMKEIHEIAKLYKHIEECVGFPLSMFFQANSSYLELVIKTKELKEKTKSKTIKPFDINDINVVSIKYDVNTLALMIQNIRNRILTENESSLLEVLKWFDNYEDLDKRLFINNVRELAAKMLKNQRDEEAN